MREDFQVIVAAGGDGTLNEVLNGIGEEPDGFGRARLGVLPLGTVNVFAREIGMPLGLRRAWEVIRRGRESAIDLPQAEFGARDKSQRRWFAQLAGAGLDAHAVELVDWKLKKKIGFFAYVATTTNLAAGVLSFSSDAYTYTAVGDFTVTLTVTDNAGASATATSSVSVHQPNQAPSVALFGVTAGSEGGSSALALTFADVDALDTHTVSVAWGDGSTSDPTVLAAGVTGFEASHVYADTGTYSVVLTLADSAGHTVTANASVYHQESTRWRRRPLTFPISVAMAVSAPSRLKSARFPASRKWTAW